MILEFAALVFIYMLILTFALRKIGGRELAEIEREVEKLLNQVRKGKEEAFDKLNRANAQRMRIVMKAQLYLLPLIILFIYLLKKRYASLSITFLGIKMGWLALFILLGIPFSLISEKIVKKILRY